MTHRDDEQALPAPTELSDEELELETAIELPDREVMSVVYPVIVPPLMRAVGPAADVTVAPPVSDQADTPPSVDAT